MNWHRPGHKYNATRVEFDGIKFASRAEAARYQVLKLAEKSGRIQKLELQPRFVLVPKCETQGHKQRAAYYQADFKYLEDGKPVVEDVKGYPTETAKLKMKMFRYLHPELELRITR